MNTNYLDGRLHTSLPLPRHAYHPNASLGLASRQAYVGMPASRRAG